MANAQHKVKKKEDEKLWKGLESRMLILKHYIIWLVRFIMLILILVLTAEKDKVFFEDKLAVSALAIDELNRQMNGLSLKLESAEATVGNHELKELSIEKDKREESYRDELPILLRRKDSSFLRTTQAPMSNMPKKVETAYAGIITSIPKHNRKEIKGGDHQRPSNIGNLFTEGSLKSYTDDPYAFD